MTVDTGGFSQCNKFIEKKGDPFSYEYLCAFVLYQHGGENWRWVWGGGERGKEGAHSAAFLCSFLGETSALRFFMHLLENILMIDNMLSRVSKKCHIFF